MCNHLDVAYIGSEMWSGRRGAWSTGSWSGGIEPYLESLRLDLFEKLGSESGVTPCLQEPEGDVFCRSHSSWESSPSLTIPCVARTASALGLRLWIC